jgi:hypothetical protein
MPFEYKFDCYNITGHKGVNDPYIVTKAYNSSPSDIGSLTSVILQLKGVGGTTSQITLSYSLTSEADDFKVIKVFNAFAFNGDIQNVEIPVPTAYIINSHHYRLKLESTNYVEVYNMERRFRVRGMLR